MADAILALSRLTVAVPDDLAKAIRTTAEMRGISGADYIRGALQARLMLDGAAFRPIPNIRRLASRAGRVRTI